MLAVREDVDTGWALLDVGQAVNSTKDIQDSLNNATKALVDLREKSLKVAFDILGYNKTELPLGVV